MPPKRSFDLGDYVEVPERIQQFKDLYPEGSLQPWEPPVVMQLGERTFIRYTAAAYRHPEDPRPGVGTAYEQFPGVTPYTRNSELMNAETSAWGRAIVALGIAAKKIASREEVVNRRAEEEVAAENEKEPTKGQRDKLNALIGRLDGLDDSRDWWESVILPWLQSKQIDFDTINSGQMDYLTEKVEGIVVRFRDIDRDQRADLQPEEAPESDY